jgi:hypothetical protein
MAHDVLHLEFLGQVTSDPRLNADARGLLQEQREAARSGSLIIDLPYFEGFGAKVVGHLVGGDEAPSPWGDRLHRRCAMGLVRAMLDVSRDGTHRDQTTALALGHLSHAVLDLQTHPHVNRFVRQPGSAGAAPHQQHRRLENVQVELWHRTHRGEPLFGSRRMGQLASGSASFLGTATLTGLNAALRLACGEAPTPGAWRRWTFGLWQYAGLVGSPLARFYFRERDLDELKPWFSGPELDFEGVWSDAVAAAVAAVNQAWELARAPGGLERIEFARHLPERNLDEPGEAPEPE